MPYHLVVKISGAVTIALGIFTGYRIVNYLSSKNQRIELINDLKENSKKLVLVAGIVTSKDSSLNQIACKISKKKIIGFNNRVLKSIITRSTESFQIKDDSGSILTVIPTSNMKIMNHKPRISHTLLPLTIWESFKLMIYNFINTASNSNSLDMAVSEKKAKKAVKFNDRIVIQGYLGLDNVLKIEPDFIADSKEAIVKHFLKKLNTAFVWLAFSVSATYILELFLKQKSPAIRGPEVDAPEELQCIVCLSAYRKVLLHPCNHLCLCESCMKNLTNCPVCRKRIEYFQKVNY